MTSAKSKEVIKGTLELLKQREDDADEVGHKFFNLQKIIKVTGIQPDKVYNNFKDKYNSLTIDEKKQIATCLMLPVKNVFERLGMVVSFAPTQEAREEIVRREQEKVNRELNRELNRLADNEGK
jgi:hypothetical protein